MNLRPRRTNLTEEEKKRLLQKIAVFKTNSMILEEFAEETGKRISESAVDYYRKSDEYAILIERYRDEFEASIKDVEFVSKRRRIEELQRLYYSAVKENHTPIVCAKILSLIREEREGRYQSGDIYQFNQYNAMTDEELRSKLEENTKALIQLRERKRIIDASQITGAT